MTSRKLTYPLALFSGTILTVFLFLAPLHASAANIVLDAPPQYNQWAWSDTIGWIDFYNSNNGATVGSSQVTGVASSSAGDIYLSCNGSNNPVGCGTVTYGVVNDGNGNLSGWAWNGTIGWISFCGTVGTGTQNCWQTGVQYRVTINPNAGNTLGLFTGWAWNDVVGWISFNCANPEAGGCGKNYTLTTTWFPTSVSGSLDSAILDTKIQKGAQLNSVIWEGQTPTDTFVYFKIAGSNCPNGQTNFPTCTTGSWTWYPQTVYGYASIPVVSDPCGCRFRVSIPYNAFDAPFQNKQYFRYQVTLLKAPLVLATPRVDSISLNWSP